LKAQITGLFLLMVLLLPAIVSFSWLQHRKYIVRKEVKQYIIKGIDKTELQVLQFHHQEVNQKVQWEHSKEFEFEGKMYDVVEKEMVNDSIRFFCWLDEEETELNKRLKSLLTDVYKNDLPLKMKNDLVFDFYKTLFFYQNELITFKTNFEEQQFQELEYNNKYFYQYHKADIHPPIFV